jgi:N-methylhydantoinase A/oxoprolinase/acetone carboxylase beta subunit
MERYGIGIDVGGTSYDVCLIADGQRRVDFDAFPP